MRVLICIVMLFTFTFAQNITIDGIEDLFRKYMTKNLTWKESKQLQEVIEILQRPEHISRNSFEDGPSHRTTLDCLICRSAFAAVFEGVQNGQDDEEIIRVVINLCTSLNIESYNVCYGAVKLNLPIITHIIRTTPEATPRTFCGLVLQQAGNPNTCRIEDPRFEWEVELPPKRPTGHIMPQTDHVKPLKIAVITDAHIDPLYEPYGVADCDEPVCCRKGQLKRVSSKRNDNNLEDYYIKQSLKNNSDEIILDLRLAAQIKHLRNVKNTEPAGYWGDYRNCDTPIWAFDNVIDTITENHKDIDVVYYIGDTIDHGVWETSYQLINDMNQHVINKIWTSFGENVLVVPVIGNHESQPTNQFAPTSVIGEKLNTTWLYEALANKWDIYLCEKAKESLRVRGGFSIRVRPALKVITLNNNIAYKFNWWLVYDPLDAKRLLEWLIDELYESEQIGEKVHILAHIPPGVSDLTHTWTREYNIIINRFSSIIAAEFNGHTHSDEFKIFYNLTDDRPINVAWGAGSTTSYTFYNLNYKIIDFNPDTFEPTRIVNYVYNLTEANLTPDRPPHWFELYDMKNTFDLTDLSAASMDDLVRRMVTTNKELLDKYAAFFSKMSDNRWSTCNDWCKLDNLCKTVVTVLWERRRCDELNRLFYG